METSLYQSVLTIDYSLLCYLLWHPNINTIIFYVHENIETGTWEVVDAKCDINNLKNSFTTAIKNSIIFFIQYTGAYTYMQIQIKCLSQSVL